MKKFYAAVGISAVLATGLGGCAASNGVVASGAPTDPYGIGKEKFAAGQFGLALESFQKALDQNGPSVDRLNALAATYDQLSRFDLADRAYRQALVLDPESAQTLNNIGYSYLLRGRADVVRNRGSRRPGRDRAPLLPAASQRDRAAFLARAGRGDPASPARRHRVAARRAARAQPTCGGA